MRKIMFSIGLLLVVFLSACTTSTPEPEETVIRFELSPSQDTVNIGSTWTDPGALFIINDSDLTVYGTGQVNTDVKGIYEIEYAYIYNDEIYKLNRYVFVKDIEAPVITLNEGVDTILVGSDWVDAGVMVTDNIDADIEVTVSGEVNTTIAGEYIIKYIAEDTKGNETIEVRYVNVVN